MTYYEMSFSATILFLLCPISKEPVNLIYFLFLIFFYPLNFFPLLGFSLLVTSLLCLVTPHEIWKKKFEDTVMIIDTRLMLSEEIRVWITLGININRPLDLKCFSNGWAKFMASLWN